jgi:hypothetical protein
MESIEFRDPHSNLEAIENYKSWSYLKGG